MLQMVPKEVVRTNASKYLDAIEKGNRDFRF